MSKYKLDEISDLAAGMMGEHIVCADILRQGLIPHRMDQICSYDILIDADRPIKVQVKTTRSPKPVPQRVNHAEAYLWHTKRHGKSGAKRYCGHEFDLLALVALDVGMIAYMPYGYKAGVVIIRQPGEAPRVKSRPGKHFVDYPLIEALKGIAT